MLKNVFKIYVEDEHLIIKIHRCRVHIPLLNDFICNLFKIMRNADNVKLVEILNGTAEVGEGSCLNFLRDKTVLLKRLNDNAGRDFLSLNSSNFSEFQAFANKHKKIAAKQNCLSGGRNIKIIDVENHQDLRALYDFLIGENIDLLEEYIFNEESINEIYSKALTTVRISTLRTGNDPNDIEIVGKPYIQIGAHNLKTNSQNAAVMQIDIETGKLCGKAYLAGGRRLKKNKHPDTEYSLDGFVVPYFEDVKRAAIEGAKLIPEVNFIGWDIAITKNGPVIVEGNGGPCSYLVEQLFSFGKNAKGVRDYYETLAQYFKFKTGNKSPDKINEIIFLPENEENKDFLPDYVIILGSENCAYKVQYAISEFAKNKDTIFVASGGNAGSDNKLECDRIKEILLNAKIPPEKIICEGNSKNTYQNILYSCKLIFKNKKMTVPKIAIISASFHTKRVSKILNSFKKYKADFGIFQTDGPNTGRDNWYKNLKGFFIIKNELLKTVKKTEVKKILE